MGMIDRLANAEHRLASSGMVRFAAIGATLLAGCVGTLASERDATSRAGGPDAPPHEAFVDPADLDPAIPAPESFIGHAVGEKAVRYNALFAYLAALADGSPLVTMTPYAETHEGRTLYYLTITSEANHARLAQIREDNAKLADPRKLSDDSEAEKIIDENPGVAWLAYSIHGDELSSTDAAMQLAYQLAAGTDDATQRLRDELVIHIDPLMNPDGRERYLGQLEQLTGKVPNTDYQAMQHRGLWSAGRGNHYLFDLNRDWLMQVHPETRGRAAAILSWNPHLVVDSHEMGGLDTYLFDPPREPFNVHLSEGNMKWRRRFSADQAAAFDAHGWSYYTGEWYEEWYPGYTNAWANLLGAVGILYEQAGVNQAALKHPSGWTLTYHDAVHHHLTSSLANLETLRANRREILAEYHADRKWAVSDEGPFVETFLLPPQTDHSKFARFADLLRRHGIEVTISDTPITASGVSDVWGKALDSLALPAGTLVASSHQPHRRILHAVLGFDPHMSDSFLLEERNDLENRRGSRIYDQTAWNLPMAYGLEGYWATDVREGADDAPVAPSRETETDLSSPPQYGYLIDGADADVYPALVALLDAECKPRVATKPFTVAGRSYLPGSVLLRRYENPDGLADRLRELVIDFNVDVAPVGTALAEEGPDLGGRRFRLLNRPRVAIASQWPIATTSFGSTWLLLDERLRLRASPINVQRLGRMDLRAYNVLILPHTWSPGMLAGVLDKGAVRRLRQWIEAGGTLIALGNSAAFVAGKDRGLSGVRIRREVLDKLGEYAEAHEREQAARSIEIDPASIWGDTPDEPEGDTMRDDSAAGDGADDADASDADENESSSSADKNKTDKPASGKSDKEKDKEKLERDDAWNRIFSPQGAMVAAQLDPEHWLTFGAGPASGPARPVREARRLSVMVAGGYAYMSKYPVATPVRLAGKDDLRLSGLLWPEARQRLQHTAYATVERVGNGQIILFAADPFFRGYAEGTGRLLLNAVLLGPGMGASAPLPW